MDSQIMGPTPNKALMVAGKKKKEKQKKGRAGVRTQGLSEI